MPERLDVYRDWLGIKDTARPLDCYQLLRLARFADDTQKIRTHYRKMNSHVRKFATGPYAAESQELLNELARAMLCLTDVQRKREYDASLGRKVAAEGRQRTLEEILLAGKTIDRDQLDKARSYADAVGLEVRDALVQQKMAAPDVVMLAYAESLGLPYVELEDVGVDEELVPRVPPTLARQHSCVPLMTDEGQLLMASPNPLIPDVEEELRLRFNMPVRSVLCTPASINTIVAKYYPRDAAGPLPRAVASKKPVAKKVPQREESEPRSRDEQSKRHKMFAVIAFNVTVMLCMVFLVVFRGTMSALGFWDFVIAVFLALAAATATFVVAHKKDL
ncbi:MAG: GspE/PulE/PilB domain-containing protein [Planctomycetota bacterium]|jgi:hypothetical protein